MQVYSHELSIRISHPLLDPDEVSRVLGFSPEYAWRTGDERRTPKGTLLQGTRKEGYWSCDPFDYGWRPSGDALVEDALEELVTALEPHREFLTNLSQGGTVRLWACTQSNRNLAIELTPTMLSRLAVLGATFVHDVYPGA